MMPGRLDPATGVTVVYNHATTGGAMAGGTPTSLAAARDGSLWIGLEETGALHFFPGDWNAGRGTWIPYMAENGLPADEITAVAVDPQGIVWFGSDRYRLFRCLARP